MPVARCNAQSRAQVQYNLADGTLATPLTFFFTNIVAGTNLVIYTNGNGSITIAGAATPVTPPTSFTNAFISLSINTNPYVAALSSINPWVIAGYSYSNKVGAIGLTTNASVWLTNDGNYYIAFGAGINGANNDLLSLELFTNDTLMGAISQDYTMKNPSVTELGSKTVIVFIPADTRLDMRLTSSLGSDASLSNAFLTIISLAPR